MLMCFVCHSTTGLTVRNIAAWLSAHSGISLLMVYPISLLKDFSHAACHPVLANSIYSASPTDSATVFCCCDAQDIAPSGRCVLMCPDDHLCCHPNLSLSIWLIWCQNFHHIWFSVLLYPWGTLEHILHTWCVLPLDYYWIMIVSLLQMQYQV